MRSAALVKYAMRFATVLTALGASIGAITLTASPAFATCSAPQNNYSYQEVTSTGTFDGVSAIDQESTLTPFVCGNGDHTLQALELYLKNGIVAETGEDRGPVGGTQGSCSCSDRLYYFNFTEFSDGSSTFYVNGAVSNLAHRDGSQLYVTCSPTCTLFVYYYTDSTRWQTVTLPPNVNPSTFIATQGEVYGLNGQTGKGSTLYSYQYHYGSSAYWNNSTVDSANFPYCNHQLSSAGSGSSFETQNYGPYPPPVRSGC